VATVELEILAEVRKASKDVRAFGDSATKSLTGVEKAFGAIVTGGGALIALELGSRIIEGVSQAVDQLGDFSTALSEINSIASDSVKQNEDLADTLVDVAAEFGTEATTQAKTFYQIISAGVSDAAKAQDLLIVSNKLAVAGVADVGASVDILTSALNVYTKSNLSATEASDALFKAVELGKTSIPELSSSLGGVLPVAQALNISFDTVAATIATLTAKGIPSTAEAVTGLKSIFTGLLEAQGKVAKESEEVQKAFSLQALETKSLDKFLKDMLKSVDGSKVKLKQLIGSSEALTSILALAGDGFDTLGDNIDSMSTKAGASEEAFKEISDSIGFQLNKLKNNFSNLILKISLSGSESVLAIIKSMNKSFAGLQKIAKETGKVMDDIASGFKTGFGLAAEEQKKFTNGLETGAKALDDARASFFNLRESLAGLSAKRKEIIAQNKGFLNSFFGIEKSTRIIDEQIAKLTEQKKSQRELIKGLEDQVGAFGEIKKAADASAKAEEDRFDAVRAAALKLSTEQKKLAAGHTKLVTDQATADADAAKKQLALSLKADQEFQKKISGAIAGSISGGVEGAAGAAVSIIGDIIAPGFGEAFGAAFNLLASDTEEFEKKIEQLFSPELFLNIAQNIGTLFDKMPELAKELIKGIIAALPELAKSLAKPEFFTELTFAIIQGLAEGLVELAQSIGVVEFFNGAVEALGEAFDVLGQGMKDAFAAAGRALLAAGTALVDGVKAGFQAIIDGFLAIPELIGAAITGVIDGIKSLRDSIMAIPGAMVDGAVAAGEAITDAIVAVGEFFTTVIPDALAAAGDAVGEAFSAAAGFITDAAADMLNAFISLPGILADEVADFGVLIFDSVVQALEDAFTSVGDSLGDFFDWLTPITDAMKEAGGELASLLTGGLVGGGDEGGGFLSKLNPFAEGGVVPAGFPNDTFPAGLTSGETVLTPDQLKKILSGRSESAGEQNLTILLQIGEQELSRVILNLNRQGFRTA